MVSLGIFLSFLTGFVTVNLISVKFTLIEKLGLSFPVGIALQTLLMLLLDAINIPLTNVSVLIAGAIFILALSIPLIFRRKEFVQDIKQPLVLDFSGFNLVWLLFVILIIIVEYMNFSRCIYFPTYDRDSLSGFDTIGYIISQEHTLKGLSIFQGDYMPSIHSPGSYITYTPMVQLSYAYVYLLGAPTSKLIPGLMYLFFLVAFYAAANRVINRTGAAIVTFFMLITPDMLGFSSLSGTNVIHAVTASLGIIYLAIWFRYREKKDLYLGSLLLALNVWTRTEGIVFIGAAVCIVGYDSIRRRQYRNLIPVLLSVTPALLWSLFMKLNGLYAESIAIIRPFWDKEKMNVIYTYMKDHYTNGYYYGWTFSAAFFSFLINIRNVIKAKDNLRLLLMILLASLFYIIILYQIDYKWDTIENVLAYSAKRFLFCFVPCVWFFTMTNKIVITGLNKLERYLSFR
ncbi:hypothetical protein [Coprobacter sp.]